MTTYIILGSNSFSGTVFIKNLLNRGHRVIALSRSSKKKKVFNPNYLDQNYYFNKFDINKDIKKLKNYLNRKEEYVIVNFSAQGMVEESWLNPQHWYQTNIIGQVNFINEILSLKLNILKFIQFSTPEVYGSTPSFIDENYKHNPSTPYAISRNCFDNHLLALNKTQNFPVILTRTANVYGPYQDLYRIIPKTFMSILMKRKLFLHGGGKSTRCFVHMDDVSNAILSIIEKGNIGDTYHISSTESITIKNLVKKISKIMDAKFDGLVSNSKERVGKDEKYLLSIGKIQK